MQETQSSNFPVVTRIFDPIKISCTTPYQTETWLEIKVFGIQENN